MNGHKRSVGVCLCLPALAAFAAWAGCGDSSTLSPEYLEVERTPAQWTASYALEDDAAGVIEFYDQFYNLSVASKNDNHLKAEYQAGYVQGRLSERLIPEARDNAIEGAVREAGLPVELIPPAKPVVEALLGVNLGYSLGWIERCEDAPLREKLLGLLYRMRGIARGASGGDPEPLRFDGQEAFEAGFFPEGELALAYGRDTATFMDVYFLNAATDLIDIASRFVPLASLAERCTAFIKRTPTDLIIAHTTWTLYSLSVPVRFNLYLNGEYMSVQQLNPGLLCSATDFGYNGHGILFNETTVSQQGRARNSINALWTFWRAGLAELYSRSMEEFFEYMSLENSGTYMNGYQLGETGSKSFGLVEMDEHVFYFLRPRQGGGHEIVCKPECTDRSYDQTMASDEYVIGFNYPVARAVRRSLNYPEEPVDIRYRQLLDRIEGVTDVASAKSVITYHDDAVPRSISSRWDLVPGHPRPGGSVDAKVVSARMLEGLLEKRGVLEPALWWGRTDGCWMKFGPPSSGGEPFVWSASQWADWRHELLPDVMSGQWQMYFSHVQ
jgi:hypothetical protein